MTESDQYTWTRVGVLPADRELSGANRDIFYALDYLLYVNYISVNFIQIKDVLLDCQYKNKVRK